MSECTRGQTDSFLRNVDFSFFQRMKKFLKQIDKQYFNLLNCLMEEDERICSFWFDIQQKFKSCLRNQNCITRLFAGRIKALAWRRPCCREQQAASRRTDARTNNSRPTDRPASSKDRQTTNISSRSDAGWLASWLAD